MGYPDFEPVRFVEEWSCAVVVIAMVPNPGPWLRKTVMCLCTVDILGGLS